MQGRNMAKLGWKGACACSFPASDEGKVRVSRLAVNVRYQYLTYQYQPSSIWSYISSIYTKIYCSSKMSHLMLYRNTFSSPDLRMLFAEGEDES